MAALCSVANLSRVELNSVYKSLCLPVSGLYISKFSSNLEQSITETRTPLFTDATPFHVDNIK